MGPSSHHLPYLDGIRGIAALWVLLFHTQLLSGMSRVPVLSYGELAVDLFMIMSGVLMAHHAILRQHLEPWESPRSWCIFWIRRFFRIAPIYYLVVAVALVLAPTLGEYRYALSLAWPDAQTDMLRYQDQSFTNVLAHVSFVFGFLPDYSFRTPLPDWSIGLEMQFYAVFPFLLLLIQKFGLFRMSLGAIIISLLLSFVFRDFFSQFELPSLLPMKLYLFLCGIVIASARFSGSMLRALLFTTSMAILYCALHPSLESMLRVGMIVAVSYLLDNGTLPNFRLLEKVLVYSRTILGNKAGHFLGEMSYSVYLVHLLILIPISSSLLRFSQYTYASGLERFCICLAITIPLVYFVSAILHATVEKRGITAGKRIAASLRSIRIKPMQPIAGSL